MAADQEAPWSPSECYERTYSRSLSQTLDALKQASTTNDYAIACALSELSEAQLPRPDTSYDEQLALSLHAREADKLTRRAPSSRRLRRRTKALRSLLKHVKPTQVGRRLHICTVLPLPHARCMHACTYACVCTSACLHAQTCHANVPCALSACLCGFVRVSPAVGAAAQPHVLFAQR